MYLGDKISLFENNVYTVHVNTTEYVHIYAEIF